MKKYSILLFGGSGKMGKELQLLINSHNFFSLYKSTGSNLDGIDPKKIDLVIDFSNQKSFCNIIKWSKDNKKFFLSGTTGLTKLDFDLLKTSALTIPVFWSSNMSTGIYLLGLCLDLISKKSKNFNYNIEETHHIEKKDSPSGTAINLSNILNNNNVDSKILSNRKKQELGIHKVDISSPEEGLTLEHKTYNRSLFAKGAMQAAEFLVLQQPGLYKMKNLFS
ncbi:MAG: 4-hydroxy-tetrahydrodipicolinate reductase [Bdellovibrionales bacterium]|nr:4-hydroxy-tetrahydrodipicolinate reductase [Bdellovibrionales bacterium]